MWIFSTTQGIQGTGEWSFHHGQVAAKHQATLATVATERPILAGMGHDMHHIPRRDLPVKFVKGKKHVKQLKQNIGTVT